MSIIPKGTKVRILPTGEVGTVTDRFVVSSSGETFYSVSLEDAPLARSRYTAIATSVASLRADQVEVIS